MDCPWLARLIAACLCLPLFAAPARSAGVVGPNVIEVTVQNTAGEKIQPLADAGQKATVLFFVMHECPVANGYAPEISRIMHDYAAKGVRSHVVYVEADITLEQARKHAQDYGFKTGGVMDSKHLLVKAAGATISPEAAVISAKGDVLYLGRIDDRVTDFGKRRVEPTRRDLRLTLDAILAGQPVPTRRTKAIGCYIPEDHSSKAEH
jgi:peroxiredoxin